MRYFERLVTETNDYRLSIVERIPEFGFLLYALMEGSSRLKCVGGKDTLQACKELELEMYGAPMDGWRSEGGYFESLVATNNEGDTFRIVEVEERAFIYTLSISVALAICEIRFRHVRK
jgi:hypothetical protein